MMDMNTVSTLRWIKVHLGPLIRQAIQEAKEKSPDLPYTEEWIGGITMRETGELIARYVSCGLPAGKEVQTLAPLMKGDYGRRSGEMTPQYHGFGFMQIDIASFPAFVRSGDWKDAGKVYKMALAVLEDKRKYLKAHFPTLTGSDCERSITAAYNCGEGNAGKAIIAGQDVDTRTAGRDYVKAVWAYRNIYLQLDLFKRN